MPPRRATPAPRPKTHKRVLGKYSPANQHKLHKVYKTIRSMIYRRGRAVGRGGGGDDRSDMKYEIMMQEARDMLKKGATMQQVREKFPELQ